MATVPETLKTATALLDLLTDDVRRLSRCVATLENLKTGRLSDHSHRNFVAVHEMVTALATRYRGIR